MFGTKLGYAEYCAIPEDGLRHEVIDGVHFVNSVAVFAAPARFGADLRRDLYLDRSRQARTGHQLADGRAALGA